MRKKHARVGDPAAGIKKHIVAAHPLNLLSSQELAGSGKGAEAILSAPCRYQDDEAQESHRVHAREDEEFSFFLSAHYTLRSE